MSELQSVGAVRRGFVRGVVSSRLGGVAFPADLVRVAAGIARRDGARRRVASAFAGYLVTDSEPVFSVRRGRYLAMFEGWTIGRSGFSAGDDSGGDLDATGWFAAGSMRACEGRMAERRAYPVFVHRDAGEA